MSKQLRIHKFLELEELVHSGLYDFKHAAEIIESSSLTNINRKNPSSIKILKESVIETIDKENNAAVLVFCSAKNPGGGVRQGSIAQEEEISLHSTWYFQVKHLDAFYDKKIKTSALNNDRLIFVDNGYLLKNNQWLDIYKPVSFIGSTAVNLNGLKDQNKNISNSDIENIMSNRIENILKLAQHKNKSCLILGAFGCGVFGLNSHMISNIFLNKINEGFFGGDIIFSIPDDKNYEIFSKTFSTSQFLEIKYNFTPKL